MLVLLLERANVGGLCPGREVARASGGHHEVRVGQLPLLPLRGGDVHLLLRGVDRRHGALQEALAERVRVGNSSLVGEI